MIKRALNASHLENLEAAVRIIRDLQRDMCSPWKPRGFTRFDTPVLDIKPYMLEFAARGDVHRPEWARELRVGDWNTAE